MASASASAGGKSTARIVNGRDAVLMGTVVSIPLGFGTNPYGQDPYGQGLYSETLTVPLGRDTASFLGSRALAVASGRTGVTI